jgi:hypothetical protein
MIYSSDSIELNNYVINNISINTQENIILKAIESFYNIKSNSDYFIKIINFESNISIRLIDYFITKYCKKNKVAYKLNNDIFNIYISYKQQLKMYKKKYFDPFSRGDRIPYFINDTCIITTVGQLNFFKWFVSKDIHLYIQNNKDYIEYDMNKKNKVEKTNKIKKSTNIYKATKCSFVNKTNIIDENNNNNTITNNTITNHSIRNIIVSFN